MRYIKNILLVGLMLLPVATRAQFKGTSTRVVEADVFKGFILKHKPQIAHLITDHPTGFRISVDRKTYGDEPWQQRYNFPDVGMTLVYLDYNDERLGKSIGLIPHFSYYFTRNKESIHQFKTKIGLGLGYNTEKYNKEGNNKNNVLSTDFCFGIILQTEYERKLSERLFLNTYLALTHFSNGAIKKPNSGINVISTNIGLSYLINYQPREYTYSEEEPLDKKGLGYTLTVSSGMHEYSKINSGPRPFIVISALAEKRLNHKSALGLAVDWFGSLSMRDDIKYDDTWEEGEERPDWYRIGLALSHELFINSVSLISQAGYYVHDEYDYYGSIYFRLGVRKYLNKNLYTSLVVKSHGAKAEAAEFALGWRFR